MSVREPDPAGAIGDLMSVSDERDRQLRWRLEAWREGWNAGHEAGYERGRLDAARDIKRIQHELAGVFARGAEAERGRWWLRGQRRTRRTFPDPHPDDYTGGAA